ncbi:MAG: virulence RhuM family protein [Paludibacteraceae bacterium]|nr:virulence RhuM family protein [Paludibacteraceae bacterium]
MAQKNEIVLYQPDEAVRIEVRMDGETVWLNRHQMATLFGRDVKTIGKHISNALSEELAEISVVANFATTASNGKTYNMEYYNLDMILSIGYRVKSRQGILFRQWANKVLKEYLLNGHAVNQRIERLEHRVTETENKIDFFVRTSLPPVEGIFYDGQIFDAYKFVNDLIRSAKHRIVLIDNYVDDTVLQMLDKRRESVEATIFTKSLNATFRLDVQRHNAQYRPVTVREFAHSHDRFLVIDDEVYHIGASIKDLGKKWFSFCKMELRAEELLRRVETV